MRSRASATCGLPIYEYNQRNVKGQWATIINDITDVTGDAFLGLDYNARDVTTTNSTDFAARLLPAAGVLCAAVAA